MTRVHPANRHPILLLLLLLLPGLWLLGGCNSNDDVVPSCLPPGCRPKIAPDTSRRSPSEVQGEELDVKLAVVEGEVITRRRLVREVGGLAPGQDPADLERQVQQRLLQRARLLVFVKEAERAGVSIPDHLLDKVLAEQLESRRKEAEKTIGEPVTVEEYLADRGLTMDEFRERVKEELLFQAYVVKLKEGLGGPTRSQVDMVVRPSEVRAMYWGHPGAFDEKPAVRFVAFQFPVDKYLVDDVGFLDAEEKSMEDAEGLVAAFRQGGEPEALAKRFDVPTGRWRASEEEKFSEEGGQIRALGEEANIWLFDKSRKAGDATILPDPDGPFVLGLLEKRAGRRMPYAEAHDVIVKLIREIRERRLIEQRLIEILSTRDVIDPDAIAARLLAEARRTLAEFDSDPVVGSAKFR